MNVSGVLRRVSRKVRPKALHSVGLVGSEAAHERRYPLLPPPQLRSVIVQDLEDVIPLSSSAVTQSGSAAPTSTPEGITGRQLWVASKLARESKAIRRSQQVCVVGGEESIRRIWHEYKIPPNVLYVSNLEGEEAWQAGASPAQTHGLPSWCVADPEAPPTYIVRCSPIHIRKSLLSAELSTPYGAEFPWHDSLLQPLSSLTVAEKRTSSLLVLVGLRIPSNVGMLINSAVSMGFESVALINCCDPFQEKVVRASRGTVFSPKLHLYEHITTDDVVSSLCLLAQKHHLIPLLAVPSQENEEAFEVAKRFHFQNREAAAEGKHRLGPMLVLGGESQGLGVLADGEWDVPFQTVCLPLTNTFIDSFNVGVAGSILMDLFRPGSESHFARVAVTADGAAPLLDTSQE